MDDHTPRLVTENTDICRKLQLPVPRTLLVEHELSCLIKVYAAAEEHIVLVDAAVTQPCFVIMQRF